MKVVSNSSPIITLSNIDHLFLLNKLFAEVLVPQAVWDEVHAKRQTELPAWVQRRTLEQPLRLPEQGVCSSLDSVEVIGEVYSLEREHAID